MKISQLLKEPPVIAGLLSGLLIGLHLILLSYKIIPLYKPAPMFIMWVSVIAGRLIGERLQK